MKIHSLAIILVLYLGFPRFTSQQSPVCGTLSDDNFYACLNLASDQIDSICGAQPSPTASDSSARRFNQCMCTNMVLTINCYLQCPGQRIRMNQLKADQTLFCDAAKPPPSTTSTITRTIITFSQLPGTNTKDSSNNTIMTTTTTAAMIQRPPLKTNHAAGDVQEPLAALVGGAMAAAAMLLG